MTEIILSNVRLAFADLFEAKAFAGGGDPRFSATAIIDPKSVNVALIDNTIKDVARAKWGTKADAILAKIVEDKKLCFTKQPKTDANGNVYEGFEGMFSLTASNKARPLVIDRNPANILAAVDGRPYSGSYVNLKVDLWAQDNQYGRRINATLLVAQFVRDGDSFGGARIPTTDGMPDLAVEEELA